MRIGIDARLYKKGLGIGRYIEKLLASLEKLEDGHEYVIFLRKEMMEKYRPSSRRFRAVCADIQWYSWKEQVILPFLFVRERLDLLHVPHFNVPLMYVKPFCVTIHDCILLKHPASATLAATTRHPLIHWFKWLTYRFVLTIVLRRARAIIAVSYAVKDDLIKLCRADSKRISVIYEAAERCVGNGIHETLPTLPRNYVLYAGNAYPHKNLYRLIDAFELLVKKKSPLSLVLCGQEDFFMRQLCAYIQLKGLGQTVVHLGNVSDEVLARLYTHASGYVFPSCEEGFGLPPLEAMLYDLPVAASRLPVLEEILSRAVLYFNPLSVEDIAHALIRLTTDTALRETLKREGRLCAARYSWDKTAAHTSAIYSSLLS